MKISFMGNVFAVTAVQFVQHSVYVFFKDGEIKCITLNAKEFKEMVTII